MKKDKEEKKIRLIKAISKYGGVVVLVAKEMNLSIRHILKLISDDADVKEIYNDIKKMVIDDLNKEHIKMMVYEQAMNGNWKAIERLANAAGVAMPLLADEENNLLQPITMTFGINPPKRKDDVKVKFGTDDDDDNEDMGNIKFHNN